MIQLEATMTSDIVPWCQKLRRIHVWRISIVQWTLYLYLLLLPIQIYLQLSFLQQTLQMMNCVKQRNFYVKLFQTCQGRGTSAHNLITARPNFWFYLNSFPHKVLYLYFLSAPAPWPYLASQITVIMRQHCPALPCIAPTMSHPLALGSNNSLQSELSDPLLSSMQCWTPSAHKSVIYSNNLVYSF